MTLGSGAKECESPLPDLVGGPDEVRLGIDIEQLVRAAQRREAPRARRGPEESLVPDDQRRLLDVDAESHLGRRSKSTERAPPPAPAPGRPSRAGWRTGAHRDAGRGGAAVDPAGDHAGPARRSAPAGRMDESATSGSPRPWPRAVPRSPVEASRTPTRNSGSVMRSTVALVARDLGDPAGQAGAGGHRHADRDAASLPLSISTAWEKLPRPRHDPGRRPSGCRWRTAGRAQRQVGELPLGVVPLMSAALGLLQLVPQAVVLVLESS